MPPIKGRMMNLQTGRTSGVPQSAQSSIDSETVSNIGIQRRKGKFSSRGSKTTKKLVCNDEFKKLRIPKEICQSLPSVKKFANSSDFIDITNDDEEDVKMEDDDSCDSTNIVLGVKKGRGAINKYHIKALYEKRFTGMFWDLKFSPRGKDVELLVSCGEGIFMCDGELRKQKQLDKIKLAGGIGYLSDGRIVAMCRLMDVINLYSPEGKFLSDFSCGDSPMGLCILPNDEILVSDCLSKQIRAYRADGTLVRTIPPQGPEYHLRWPLYMDAMPNNSFVVVDCHLQNVLIFDRKGSFVKTIPMRTYGGNEVLHPHGLCLTPSNDIFIIDNAINTLEVFTLSGTYLQTLFPMEEGAKLKPKIVACSKNGYMALGGMGGHVRLFKFVSDAETKLDIKREVKQEVKDEQLMVPIKIKPRPRGKLEMKRINEEAEAKAAAEEKEQREKTGKDQQNDIKTEPSIKSGSKIVEIKDDMDDVTVIVLD